MKKILIILTGLLLSQIGQAGLGTGPGVNCRGGEFQFGISTAELAKNFGVEPRELLMQDYLEGRFAKLSLKKQEEMLAGNINHGNLNSYAYVGFNCKHEGGINRIKININALLKNQYRQFFSALPSNKDREIVAVFEAIDSQDSILFNTPKASLEVDMFGASKFQLIQQRHRHSAIEVTFVNKSTGQVTTVKPVH